MASTLLQYRRALARALDDLEPHVVLSATATTVTINALINSTTGASTGRYNGAYVYVASGTGAGKQRVVKTNSYVPSTGTLTTQNGSGWDATLAAGDNLEITRLFPAYNDASSSSSLGGDTDYRSLVNRALSYLLVPDQISVTTVADQQEYSLSTYAYWLDRPERLLGVLDPPRATGWSTKPTWRRWELNLDGGTPTLQFTDRAYPVSGATFELNVLRPANTLISGSESSSGLVSDASTAIPEVNDVVTIGLMLAYEALANRSPGRPNGDYLKRWSAQIELARRVRGYDVSSESPSVKAAVGEGVQSASQ